MPVRRSVTASDADDLLLPRPPGLFRRFWARHPWFADSLIAAVGFLTGYIDAIDKGRGIAGADWLVSGWLFLLVLAAAALLLRRRRPLVSLGAVIVCSALLTVTTGTLIMGPLALAIYAVAVYSGSLRALVGTAIACLGYILPALAATTALQRATPLAVILVGALLIGSNIGNRRRYLDALLERAAQLARERDQQGRLATAAERARIAREMHDVVAHSLSVMVRLSDGANAVAATDPERARTAVDQIGEVGRDALRDMRRLLGILRGDDIDDEQETAGTLAPQPSLADLPHLVETYRSAGLPVAIQETGAPPVADGLQLLVFRSVQEGLTNALRYAKEPSRVLVQLSFTDGITVVVSDDGFLPSPAPSVGSGRGLLGLRERAALYGGTVEAGPLAADGRGWRLILTVPHALEGER